MPKVEISLLINRPVEHVFAVVSNRENNLKWVPEILEVKKVSDGPIGIGTRWQEIRKFFGRQLEFEYEYTEYEPNQKITTKSKSGPFPLEFRSTFTAVEGGTQVQSSIEGEPDGFFKITESLMLNMVRRQFETALANLKELMESRVL